MTSTGSAQRRTRLSAFDALIRGLANLRANWELTLVLWVQALALTLLTLVGLVPPLLLFDFAGIAADPGSLADWEQTMESAERLLESGLPAPGPLIAALFATLLIWTLAFVVYCWIQAGVYGVLWTGDRQAPVGIRDRLAFRTFSFGDLFGWGRVHVWRYFWLINLFIALATAWILAPLLLVGLVYWAGQQWGTPVPCRSFSVGS